jgi:hypothetical protein
VSTNPIWIAGYGGTPTGGASPVWIAGYGGAVAGAAEAWIAGYGGTPAAGASPVWVKGYGGTPTGGASPIWIGGVIESGGGGGPSAQTIAYLARTVGGNEGGNAANITALIDGLVADGVWAKLDCLYVLAQQNQADAQLNLVGTSYPLTYGGLPAFTAYQGFYNFNLALNTGFNPATAPSPHFTQNNGSSSAWAFSIGIGAMIGSSTNFGCTIIIPSTFSNFYADINNGSDTFVTSTGAVGLYGGDRSTSSSVDFYLNGSNLYTASVASVAPYSTNMLIGNRLEGTLTYQGTISAAHIGASLGSAGQLALYNRLRTYLTAVGVP